MNDPNKRIDVNLSSLLSLKAELLRKHQEVNKAKISQQSNPQADPVRIGHSKSAKSKSKRDAKASAPSDEPKTTLIADTYEETELLKKSKDVLEAKSRFYDRMARAGGSLNSDENCLVMFNRKKQTEGPHNRYSSSSSSSSSDSDEAEDGDWVEYTDCLGRTRKCLKEDLESVKERDRDLAKTVKPPAPPVPEHAFVEPAAPAGQWFIDNKGESVAADSSSDEDNDDDTQSMISKSSKIDEMRSNWERQESENAGKESIHYQDVLFDEARSHGVGYYAFSTDDAERSKQQRDLETMRQKTLDAQHVRDDQRKAREKIIADRVRAAQNRQRARAGLPPLEDKPLDPEPEPVPVAVAKAAAKEAKRARKAAAEAERRATERQQHIRPWDKGKDGVSRSSSKPESTKAHSDDDGDDTKVPTEWAYKPEREPMSQEQWNEMQRAERRPEFAPIVDLPVDDMPTAYGFQSRSTTKRTGANNNQPSTVLGSASVGGGSHRFQKPFVRRNMDTSEQPQHDTEEVDYNIAPPAETQPRNPEFAPPTTFEYYGPSASKHSRSNTSLRPDALQSSIEAGLRFLREQSDKESVGTKMKWSSNAGY